MDGHDHGERKEHLVCLLPVSTLGNQRLMSDVQKIAAP